MTASLPKTLPAFFWHFIRPYKGYFFALLLLMCAWAVAMSYTPYILKVIIDKVVNYTGESSAFPSAMMWPVIGYIAMYISWDIIWRSYDYCILRMMPRIREDIINQMFTYLERHSYSYFQNNFAGSLTNKIGDMHKSVLTMIEIFISAIWRQFIVLIIASAMVYRTHPYFALLLSVWSLAFVGFVWVLSRKSQHYSTIFAEARSVFTGKIVDSISNIINAKSFSKHQYEADYLSGFVHDAVVKDQQMQRYMLKVRIMQGSLVTVLMGGMLILLVHLRSQGKVTVGDFALILTLSSYIMEGIWYLSQELVRFAEELGTCKQALSIISVPHEIVDNKDAKQLKVTEGTIEFDHVTFDYNRNANIFKDKSVVLKAGEKVGLVGFSGSGKTTFANLIVRYFDLSAGRILIDGQDISTVTQDSLREHIAMIPQDSILFHRTLMENIRYSRLNATDDEVFEASKRAHCHEFIERLPDGYNALVGERGIKLSGGQRQRIAIARAMLKNAPILILDEATSALDSVTEKLIQESLALLMEGRTTIVIAHRLSTLSEMDRILVFDKGQIMEDGTHNELLANGGHYAHLWAMQAGGFLPEGED